MMVAPLARWPGHLRDGCATCMMAHGDDLRDGVSLLGAFIMAESFDCQSGLDELYRIKKVSAAYFSMRASEESFCRKERERKM